MEALPWKCELKQVLLCAVVQPSMGPTLGI